MAVPARDCQAIALAIAGPSRRAPAIGLVASGRSRGQPSGGLQQGVQPAGALERHQVVAAPDMPAADEDLRDRHPPARAADRLLALGAAARRIDLAESSALAGQQVDGTGAVATPGLGIDLDLGHRPLLMTRK